MEVSSHALSMRRISGSRFVAVGFTNLTQDHLDFHGEMESYFQAKARLFTAEFAESALVNIDDPYGLRLFNDAQIPTKALSRLNRSADWYYEGFSPSVSGVGYEVAIRGSGGVLIEGFLPLLGLHNLDNALLAIALSVESGVDPIALASSMRKLSAPVGRLEPVEVGQKFLALVDYAHTPDAVRRALATARSLTTGRVIAVLGCGGDRDKSKRPLMGQALRDGADLAIFTSDNPRTEDPQVILREMVDGVENGKELIESDRRIAIATAVLEAEPGDCVIVLGKGHERGQEIQGIKHPFDDRLELARAIEELS
jgi:UDP-N-acetylmuramoyl-L-alanyl-D-glutamate--2,6-diaminopimelate ligase